MANVGDTLPHCTGTGTSADPYIFSTAEGFLEAIVVNQAYIEASTSNLSFDFNNVTYTLPLYFNFKSLTAKNLTILNILNMDNNIISIVDINTSTSIGHDRDITGLNMYNVTIIKYGNWMRLINAPAGYYGGTMKFTNCNFAGILLGYGNNSTSTNNRETLIGYQGSESRSTALSFENSTFNFHLKDTTNTTSAFLFAANTGSKPCVFKNCSICISGNVPNKSVYIANGMYVDFDNVTITNSATNDLTCNFFGIQTAANASYMGYNYYKLNVNAHNVNGGTDIYIRDSLALINKSKLHPYTANNWDFNGNTMVMQEDDPSASDYIYNDANLQAHGFLVGQVIT